MGGQPNKFSKFVHKVKAFGRILQKKLKVFLRILEKIVHKLKKTESSFENSQKISQFMMHSIIAVLYGGCFTLVFYLCLLEIVCGALHSPREELLK